jgi:1-deoxy-D-xylulose-5-phosphate reductoisomerase
LKHLSILGSTGSIGVNTLKVVSCFPEIYSVKGLSAGRNIRLLRNQILVHRPEIVSVQTERHARELKKSLPPTSRPEIVFGADGLKILASINSVNLVVSALVGSVGLLPTITAIKNGKNIALANKETLVMAGKLVMKEARKKKVLILPVDSEHSALFQLLKNQNSRELKSLVLTASGGPFLKYAIHKLKHVKPEDALKHPNWEMGKKVTIDSATMMNKGLEVIEARWLFNWEHTKIKVLVHPESIVHAIVEFNDGSIFAHMSNPDMRGPISYALSYPKRLDAGLPSLQLANVGKLQFKEPHHKKFPCLQLAYRALNDCESMPAVLNAANEVAVSAFLAGRIPFTEISRITEKTMDLSPSQNINCLEDVLSADNWARQKAHYLTKQFN